MQLKTKNLMSLEAAVSRRFLSSLSRIIILENFSWGTCTLLFYQNQRKLVFLCYHGWMGPLPIRHILQPVSDPEEQDTNYAG